MYNLSSPVRGFGINDGRRTIVAGQAAQNEREAEEKFSVHAQYIFDLKFNRHVHWTDYEQISSENAKSFISGMMGGTSQNPNELQSNRKNTSSLRLGS